MVDASLLGSEAQIGHLCSGAEEQIYHLRLDVSVLGSKLDDCIVLYRLSVASLALSVFRVCCVSSCDALKTIERYAPSLLGLCSIVFRMTLQASIACNA